MLELWIPITVAAAFFQNLRSALQKHLKGRLSTAGATYSRFCYAVPFAIAYVAGLAASVGPGKNGSRTKILIHAVAATPIERSLCGRCPQSGLPVARGMEANAAR